MTVKGSGAQVSRPLSRLVPDRSTNRMKADAVVGLHVNRTAGILRDPTLRFSLFLLLIFSEHSFGQLELARPRIDRIVLESKGIVGVGIRDLETGDTLSVRGDGHFPMQSVYKLPLALAVLDRVDTGTLALSQKVHVAKADLLPETWSPLRERFPRGDVDVTLDSLIVYAVAYSDNNACDMLFRLLGGPAAVDRYVHSIGISDMAIVSTEREMHQGWEIQYRNWSSPMAMAHLLEMFAGGEILTAGSTDVLWQIMAGSTTGQRRIKGLLPVGTVVAHKTGSSGANERGIAAATNDAGIIEFADGRRVVVVVFISNSDASEGGRDLVIASIARSVWDACLTR